MLVLAVAALIRGALGLRRRSGHYSSDVTADRISPVLLVAALPLVVLVRTVGAIEQDLEMPGLVSVFSVLDPLLAAVVVLTSGRRDRRRVRRRASPAVR